jgi:hypothetical protein
MVYIPTAAAAYATSERVGPHRVSLALSGLSSSSYWAATFGVDLVMVGGHVQLLNAVVPYIERESAWFDESTLEPC